MNLPILAGSCNALLLAACLAISCAQAMHQERVTTSTSSATDSRRQMEFDENKIPLELPLRDARIRVIKSTRRLMLYSGDKLVRTYRIGLGLSPVGDKVKEGDRRTPEGTYYIFTKNEKSKYYLSLGLSYPNAKDAERGLRDHLINQAEYRRILTSLGAKAAPPQNTALGGQIYIHGNGSRTDWTWGCIALDDPDMRELFDAATVGTEVIIQR